MRVPVATSEETQHRLPKFFAGLFGALLGLSLLKFGNPVILEEHLDWPPARLSGSSTQAGRW